MQHVPINFKSDSDVDVSCLSVDVGNLELNHFGDVLWM